MLLTRRTAFLAKVAVRLVILFAAGIASWLWLEGHERTISINPDRIYSEQGHAYTTLARWTRWPFVAFTDTTTNPNTSRLRLFEDQRELGPAHALHDAVRKSGQGRFSHFGSTLWLSASDNTNPRTNGRTYSARDRIFLSSTVAIPIFLLALVVLAISFREFQRKHPELASSAYRRSGLRWIAQNVVPGVLITAVLLAILAGGIEIYFRAVTPFGLLQWPSKFVPEVGFTFEPHATVRHTNYMTFWAEERANRLGFLDREPPDGPAKDGQCRVIFVGDSMVEAAQVPIRNKFHILFEHALNQKSSGRRIETVAFGYAGSGQVDQLSFHDNFVRPLRPQVLVLVVMNNDLANNNGLLEAIRHGWHPLRNPRLTAQRNLSGAVELREIDPDWQQHLLPILERRTGAVQSLHDSLWAHSYAYRWLFSLLSVRYPSLASRISGQPSYLDTLQYRTDLLRKEPDLKDQFIGWSDASLETIDTEFYNPDPLLPAFQDAVDFTDFAFGEWVKRARRDNIKLLAVTPWALQPPGKSIHYVRRVRELLHKHGIDEIDQAAYAARRGIAYDELPLQYDGHWSSSGHRRLAEQLVEYFEQHPQLCKP